MIRIKYVILIAVILPVFGLGQEKEYSFNAAISILGGIQKNDNSKTIDPVYGFEFSFECPLFQSGKRRLRQQFNAVRRKDKGYNSTTLEMYPQYKLVAGSSFAFGLGPSVGLSFSKLQPDKKTIFCYGAGASASWHFKGCFIALESRYAFTKAISYLEQPGDPESMVTGRLNNLRTVFKLGFKL